MHAEMTDGELGSTQQTADLRMKSFETAHGNESYRGLAITYSLRKSKFPNCFEVGTWFVGPGFFASDMTVSLDEAWLSPDHYIMAPF